MPPADEVRYPAPHLDRRLEDGRQLPMLVWRFPRPVRGIASGPLGGGIGTRHWVVNATVDKAYARVDPDRHLRELAAGLGLTGDGVGLLTAVDVARAVRVEDHGVVAVTTVGLGHPTWAAAPDGDLRSEPSAATLVRDAAATGIRTPGRVTPGTINIVALVPVPLSEAALVNAVATATEAKVQGLLECGVLATGTASDAVFVGCAMPGVAGDEPYAGPRSTWGARLARAVRASVVEGTRRWSASPAG